MPALAKRLPEASATIAITRRARAMRAAGVDVLSLSIGEPDFPTPPHAVEAAHAAALRGETKYPPVDGTPALKQAIQRKFRRDSGLEYGLDQIVVGNGGKQVIYNALMATVDAGDEVLIPAPYWSAYALIAQLAGAVPVFVQCPAPAFRLRPEDLDAAITTRTKWLILNFPNNPTGAACSRAEMAALGDVLLRHPHVWVLCDDIYEHLLYDDCDYATMAAAAPDLADRALTVSGVSKSYAMTGWRVGFAGGPKALIAAMADMQSQVTSGVAGVAQAAAAAALDGPQALLAERAALYRRRRDAVLAALRDAPGVACHVPEGAFYVFPSVAGCIGRTTPAGRVIDSDETFALALLEEAHVAAVHGAAFGASPYLRLSYAADDETLARACERLVAFCRALR